MNNRQKLIEELLEEHCGYSDSNCERCAFDCLIRNVVEALSQPPADQWIPCSRELPPLDEEVLIHCEKDHYNVAYFDGGDFRAFDYLYDAEDVVAWKEFERYKGE